MFSLPVTFGHSTDFGQGSTPESRWQSLPGWELVPGGFEWALPSL